MFVTIFYVYQNEVLESVSISPLLALRIWVDVKILLIYFFPLALSWTLRGTFGELEG